MRKQAIVCAELGLMKKSSNKCENPKAKGETLIPGRKISSQKGLSPS